MERKFRQKVHHREFYIIENKKWKKRQQLSRMNDEKNGNRIYFTVGSNFLRSFFNYSFFLISVIEFIQRRKCLLSICVYTFQYCLKFCFKFV